MMFRCGVDLDISRADVPFVVNTIVEAPHEVLRMKLGSRLVASSPSTHRMRALPPRVTRCRAIALVACGRSVSLSCASLLSAPAPSADNRVGARPRLSNQQITKRGKRLCYQSSLLMRWMPHIEGEGPQRQEMPSIFDAIALDVSPMPLKTETTVASCCTGSAASHRGGGSAGHRCSVSSRERLACSARLRRLEDSVTTADRHSAGSRGPPVHRTKEPGAT